MSGAVTGARQEREKERVGRRAATLVEDGMTIGLGTGSTVLHFARALGERVRAGLRVRAVATSEQSRGLADANGIPLVELDGSGDLDLLVDGADEVSVSFDMIKGGGGALLYEKIVASAARRRVFIADSAKLVQRLGRFPLPVEIVPFGHHLTLRRLAGIVGPVTLRRGPDGAPYVTSSAHYIADCRCGAIAEPGVLHERLVGVVGVVETGLFPGMIDLLITMRGDETVALAPDDGAFWASD
jgi:ribose 5-phosphate isomerase A